MSPDEKEFDAVVVGAGTAGSAAAWMLAGGGLRVALLERRALDQAGAGWVNGVPAWMFEAAGLPPPDGAENRGAARAFVLTDATGSSRMRIAPSPVTSVDMRLLVERLHGLARNAGVQILDRVRLGKLDLKDGRPDRLEIAHYPGMERRVGLALRARLFVDASGMQGSLQNRVPALSRSCPPVPGYHTCTAAQEVREIRDRAGAASFLEKHRLQPGEVLAFLGVDGGFSTANVMVDEDLGVIELLTGSIADGRHKTGSDLLGELRRREPWIGKKLFGGAGLIPLRRPYDRFVAPGLALVGDAACQVFSAHGSGTGMGLIAARLLADTVTGASDPGAGEPLWAYQSGFQRDQGAVCAAYDIFRRFAQPLSAARVGSLLQLGMLSSDVFGACLDHRIPSPGPADLLKALRGIITDPRWAGLALEVARMAATYALYRRYPRRSDPARLRRWSRAAAFLFREAPDGG